MKIGTGAEGWVEEVAERARIAEETGFDFIQMPERSHDSMFAAAFAANATATIEIGTSVTIAFPRAPFLLAQQAWEIQHLSKGRFAMGLGSQVKGHNERRFGAQWSAPAPRIKEYIRTLHAIWDNFETNEPPKFVGKTYQFTLMTPRYNPGPLPSGRPKVFLAAVGDAMARVAGEVADGILPHAFNTEKYIRDVVLENVEIGLKRAGRSWEGFEVAGGGFTVFAEDQAGIERGVEGLRQNISYYGSTRSYHEVFDVHGWRDIGEQLHRLSLDQKWQEMERILPEEVLWTFAQTSTYDDLPKFVASKRDYATRMSIGMPTRTPAERERFLHVVKEIKAAHPAARAAFEQRMAAART